MKRLWHKIVSGLFGRETSCAGKIDYKSEKTALKVKAKMEAKRAPKKFDAYNCWWCNGWHIGGSLEGMLLIRRLLSRRIAK